ncbi:MAG TPA: septum formation initiator family protein [Pseudobdellovibrionaceae bacterium]|nr:septum formation initiator family protein [Pseudobdellovibrionaceae bacterium]
MVCFVFIFVSSLVNGNMERLWNLRNDYFKISNKLATTHQQLAILNKQLKKVKDPHFLEQEAKERLNLANENELVFIFVD